MIGPDFLGPVHLQHNLVREPVRHEVHDDGEGERRHEAAGASNHLADGQQDAAEQAEQEDGLERIVHIVLDVYKAHRVSSPSPYRNRYNQRMQRVALALFVTVAVVLLPHLHAQVPQPFPGRQPPPRPAPAAPAKPTPAPPTPAPPTPAAPAAPAPPSARCQKPRRQRQCWAFRSIRQRNSWRRTMPGAGRGTTSLEAICRSQRW